MDGNLRAVLGNDFFGFDVGTLSEFIRSSLAHFAFARDMRSHLDRFAVGERLQAGIEDLQIRATGCAASPPGKMLPEPELRRAICFGARNRSPPQETRRPLPPTTMRGARRRCRRQFRSSKRVQPTTLVVAGGLELEL